MNYLFLLTISPVQSFLAQARKAHDLYAGSRLLSGLCKAGIKKAKELWGGDTIVMPNPSSPSIPNRFTAKLISDLDEGKLAEQGDEIKKAVVAEFSRIANEAITNLQTPAGFDDQILHHLDIQWLFVPIDKEYRDAFTSMNNHLMAIKNLRSFAAWEETGRKCIVDGERNVKFYRKNRGEKEVKKLWQQPNELEVLEFNAVEEVKYKDIQPGEGLSAVSFAKRKYLSTKEFPSTAGISLFDLLFEKSNGISLSETQEYKDFKGFFPDHFDEQLLFEDNLTWKYFDRHGLFASQLDDFNDDKTKAFLKKKAEEALRKHGALRKKVEEDFKKPFTKYYALIQFDGDNMGKWLSGDAELLTTGDNGELNLEEFHIDFTAAVSGFADKVEDELKAPRGRAVYAGGEDFLGFVNLHHLLPVMLWLRNLYQEMVSDVLQKKTSHYRTLGELTLSAGVVIAHYKEPLSEVLAAANAVEKMAKSSGRNCFVIRAMKHAGGDIECNLPWHLGNGDATPHVMQRILSDLETDFSNNFITQLLRTLQQMRMQPPPTLLRKELGRLVGRSCKESDPAKKKTAIQNLMGNLEAFIRHLLPGEMEIGNPDLNDKEKDIEFEKFARLKKEDFENFASILALCDFITRKTR